jgi:hypothetical protein
MVWSVTPISLRGSPIWASYSGDYEDQAKKRAANTAYFSTMKMEAVLFIET